MTELIRCSGFSKCYGRRCRIKSTNNYCKFHKDQEPVIKYLKFKVNEKKPKIDKGLSQFEDIKEKTVIQKQKYELNIMNYTEPIKALNPYKITNSKGYKVLKQVHQKFGLLKNI